MAAKAYSAGTIFLQVAPVFGDTMNEISRHAKDANKALSGEMEKAGHDAGEKASKAMGEEITKGARKQGEEAGKQYAGHFEKTFRDGIEKMQREVKPIKINVERNELRREFAEIRAEMKALGDAKIGVDLDAASAHARLVALHKRLQEVRDAAKKIDVKTNLGEAEAGLKRFIAEVEKANPELRVKVDDRELGAFERKFKATMKSAARSIGTQMDPEIAKLKQKLDRLGDATIGVDISDEEAYAELLRLESKLAQISARDATIGVDVNILTALAEIEALATEVDKLDREEIGIPVELRGWARAMAALAALRSKVHDANNDGVSAANSFRAFSFVILGVAAVLPAVIPLIAALGGALLALGPILAGVTAGVGVMVLGFSGIGDAVTALGDVQKNSAKDALQASKTMKGAARSVADAERNLARARQDAAQSSADAARAVADAERNAAQSIEAALDRRRDAVKALADAQKDAAQAERDLIAARKDAKNELRDLGDDKTANQLAIDQGVVDLFNTTVAYNTTMGDGAATNLEKEQARINLEQARLRLKNLREEGKELAKQQKKGIAGTNTVQSAQDALTAALERQKAAQEAVGEASQAVNEARIQGARAVADALRSQQRTEQSNAQAIGDAQRNLTRAQEDYQEALYQTGELGSASMQKLHDAMSKLGPAGRNFALYLHSLRGEFKALRDSAQGGLLPGVEAGMQAVLGKYGPGLQSFVRTMGKTLGDLFRRFGRMLTNPLWEDFFGMMAELGPKFMRQFGKTTMNWLSIFARLLTIAAPWAEKFSKALLKMSEHALDFVKSKKGTKIIEDFLSYAEKVGPAVWKFFKNLFGALINLGVALAPLGVLVLGLLDGFLGWIASMDPKTLGIIATAIIGLVIAFQVLNGAIFLVTVGLGLMEMIMMGGVLGVVAAVVGIVALLVVGLVILYTQSETARKIINGVFSAIGAAAKWLWNKAIKPFFGFIWDMFKAVGKGIAWTWNKIIKPVFKFFWEAAKVLWKIIGPILGFIWEAFKAMGKVYWWVWKNLLWPVIDLFITAIAKAMWKGVIKPVLGYVMARWREMSEAIREGWNKYIKPAIDAIKDAMPGLKNAFRDAVDTMSRIWSNFKDALAGPVRFLIGDIINKGIIDTFNKIAKFVGSKQMSHIPMPDFARQGTYSSASNAGKGGLDVGAATGGVLPGWSPGGDIHHFTSPTGGRLHLSGGEAVMRPEWTAAMGPDYVEKMNAVARRFGPRGVRRAMGLAKGGIFWPTDFRSLSETYPGHTGVDISIPGTGDYGKPVYAAHDGYARFRDYGETASYGHSVWIDGTDGYQTIYGHLSNWLVSTVGKMVRAGQQIGNVGSSGNSSGPHLHFEVRPGGTRDAALAYLNGGAAPSGGHGILGKLGGWAKGALSKPGDWLLGKVSGFFDKMVDSPFGSLLVGVGKKVLGGVADFIKHPGGGDSDDAGGPGDGGDAAFRLGGVYTSLKNNGTMMYDNGGMLPPGLTSVVNLTGKPEPVFTHDQLANLRGAEGGGFHYEPHFEGSDLGAEDIADDLMFAFRRLGHRAKYAGSET